MQVIACIFSDGMETVRTQTGVEVGQVGMRERLLEAAREEFGACGIEAATTRGIANRAGCNEVTLFRHFASKHNLLAAVVRETSGLFSHQCGCDAPASGDLREDLSRYAEVYTGALERCEGMMRALIGEGRRRPMLVKELIGDVLEPFHGTVSGYLEGMKRLERVREEVDTEAFAEIFTASLMGGMLRRSSGLSRMDRDAWLRETVGLLARAVEC